MPLRDFKAVFFDLDGTLVDIHGPLYIAARNALHDVGHGPPLTRERYHEGMARGDFWEGMPDDLKPRLFKLAFAYFVAEVDRTERLEVLPHVAETLVELKRREYATGVITSRPGEVRRLVEKLAMVGLAPHLDHVVTQIDSSLRALDKSESLRQTAVRAGIHPSTCIYVGDEPRDMMAAANAGYGAAVAIATGAATYAQLRDLAQYKADFVMNSMAELFDTIERLRAKGPA